jgi:hypothetical protein
MVQGSRAKKGTMTWQEEYKRKVMGPQEALQCMQSNMRTE